MRSVRISLAIAGGGAAGAISQCALDTYAMNHIVWDFPAGILLVNILGAFCMGVLAGSIIRSNKNHDILLALLGTGFLGGFTTFSTFALNTLSLYLLDGFLPALLNVLLNIFAGLLAVWCGFALAAFRPRSGHPSGTDGL